MEQHSLRRWALSGYRAIGRHVQPTMIGRWPIVQSVHSILIRRLIPKVVESQGLRFFLDATDAMALSTQDQLPLALRQLLSKVQERDVVLDVGAHIGSFALPLSRKVGANGRVIAFEPDPVNFEILARNVSTNQLENVTLESMAVTNHSGVSKLYQSTKCSALHRIHASPLCDSTTNVRTTSLDDYFRGRSNRVDLIKMDVEGGELGVLRGMTSLIELNRQMRIMMEFVPAWIVEAGHHPADLFDFMATYGFELFEVDERENAMRRATVTGLLQRYSIKSRQGTNLWCARRGNPAPSSESDDGRIRQGRMVG